MLAVILVFLALSLGVMFEIPIGPLRYQVDYSEIVLIVITFLVIIKLLNSNKAFIFKNYNRSLLFISSFLLIYSLFSYTWSPYGLTSIPGATIFIYAILSIFVGSYYLEENSEVYIIAMRIFVLSIIIQLFYNFSVGLIQGVTGFYDLKDYAVTFIGKSNFISIFISFDLIYEFISREKYWKFFFVISLVALVATISRGAIVSVAIALAVYFIVGLLNININKKKLITNFLILFILFTIAMLFTEPGKTLLKGLQAGLGASTVSSRKLLWKESFIETLLNPLGVGIVWKDDPHNILFSALRNLGVISGPLYILVIISPLFILIHPKIRLLSRKTVAILISYLSVVVHAFIEVFYFTKISVIFTMFTLLYMYIVINKDIQLINNSFLSSYRKNIKKYPFNNKIFNKLKTNRNSR